MYPLFRDAILCLSYMHNANIAHRDIKPENLMMAYKDTYQLADYGEGINLNYEQKYTKKVDYMVGNWNIAGTPGYMGPKLEE